MTEIKQPKILIGKAFEGETKSLKTIENKNDFDYTQSCVGPSKGPLFFQKRINKKSSSGEDYFLSPKNAAKYLDVSVKLVYKLIETRQIESQPVGKRLKRIRKSVLDLWLSAQF